MRSSVCSTSLLFFRVLLESMVGSASSRVGRRRDISGEIDEKPPPSHPLLMTPPTPVPPTLEEEELEPHDELYELLELLKDELRLSALPHMLWLMLTLSALLLELFFLLRGLARVFASS